MKTYGPLALDLTGLKGFLRGERPTKGWLARKGLASQTPPIGVSPAPDLNPIPVPPMEAPPPDLALHLAQTEPIDDPAGVALQVALLTATVADLRTRLEALERERWPNKSQ